MYSWRQGTYTLNRHRDRHMYIYIYTSTRNKNLIWDVPIFGRFSFRRKLNDHIPIPDDSYLKRYFKTSRIDVLLRIRLYRVLLANTLIFGFARGTVDDKQDGIFLVKRVPHGTTNRTIKIRTRLSKSIPQELQRHTLFWVDDLLLHT